MVNRRSFYVNIIFGNWRAYLRSTMMATKQHKKLIFLSNGLGMELKEFLGVLLQLHSNGLDDV